MDGFSTKVDRVRVLAIVSVIGSIVMILGGLAWLDVDVLPETPKWIAFPGFVVAVGASFSALGLARREDEISPAWVWTFPLLGAATILVVIIIGIGLRIR